jgi:hypothetical protein
VIVVTTHVMMIDVIVAVTVHSIIMMGVTLHVVVTAVVPGNTSTSSTCLRQGCSAGNQNCCPQASQKFPGFGPRALLPKLRRSRPNDAIHGPMKDVG